MLNKIFLHGPAGLADPELRRTQNGAAVTTFSPGGGPGLQGPGNRRSGRPISSMSWLGVSTARVRLPLSSPRAVMAVVEGKLQTRDWTPTGTATAAVRHGGGGRQRLFRRFPTGDGEGDYTPATSGWPEQRLRCPRRQQRLPRLRRAVTPRPPRWISLLISPTTTGSCRSDPLLRKRPMSDHSHSILRRFAIMAME